MEVTFISNARILSYEVGEITRTELTPYLYAILKQDLHLQLIDPPELPEEYPDGSAKSSGNSEKRRSTSNTNN